MGRSGQPPQTQERQPGREREMTPRPDAEPRRRGCRRLEGRVVLVTGGDSGIGRAVAAAVAQEGADVAISYLEEHDDAAETQAMVREAGRRAVLVAGDIGAEEQCRAVVERTVGELGRLDVLVNNAAEQHQVGDVLEMGREQIERTFRTNVVAMMLMVRAALTHIAEGGSIINTTSVAAYQGNPSLLDYSATKGAIVSYTRALSGALAERGIRVNAVAPGPVWTPLIPATFDADSVARFGTSTPMGRAGQPAEIAPSYVFLASDDASYMTGQVLHPNGGTVVGG
jgi:NAD(P)-dependent dehydrogenase (short-subunit alcohol dehydrogenase family)